MICKYSYPILDGYDMLYCICLIEYMELDILSAKRRSV